jgi:hypothetical protein
MPPRTPAERSSDLKGTWRFSLPVQAAFDLLDDTGAAS